MTIKVRFFARLREDLNRTELDLEWQPNDDGRTVWARATDGLSVADNILIAVNHQHKTLSSSISDGDEVAFFPPVTGG